MGEHANVRSIDALRRFRAALVKFDEEVATVLAEFRQELNRTLDWVDHDRPLYWRQQARLCFDKINQARTQLARRRMLTVAGHRPECIEEKQVLRHAKRQLEIAQEKIDVVRLCGIKAHRASDEYTCQLGRAHQMISQHVPRTLALLDHMLEALAGYAAVQKPSLAAVDESELPLKTPESHPV